MKQVPFKLIACCVAGLSFLFTSCNKDDDTRPFTYLMSVVTVSVPDPDAAPDWFVIGGEQEFYFTTDENTVLTPVSIDAYLRGRKIYKNKRVLINYNILSAKEDGAKTIELYGVADVLTKPIEVLTADTSATSVLRGKAPIFMREANVGDNFVNILFEYYGGAGSTHYINLIDNRENGHMPNPDGDTWYLEFVHDDKGDQGNRVFSGIVSFYIPGDLPENVTKIKVTAKGQGGKEESVVLDYKRDAAAQKALTIKKDTDASFK